MQTRSLVLSRPGVPARPKGKPRRAATAALWFAFVLVLVGDAGAATTHLVFGLDHEKVYTVEVDGEDLSDPEVPCEHGAIRFQTGEGYPVAIRPLDPADILDSGPPAWAGPEALVVSGPFPNPARGQAVFSIDSAAPAKAEFALIGVASGRLLLAWTAPLERGTTWIRPPRLEGRQGSGAYVLRVRAGTTTAARKFILLE